MNDFWNELNPDKKFELEKQKLKIEEIKIKLDNDVDKIQKERIAIKRISAISIAICIPLSILALCFGFSFITDKFNRANKENKEIVLDSIKIERAAENEKYKINLETPIHDTVYDTISIIQVKEVILKKEK